MEKIKKFFSNKINLAILLVVLIAVSFGGYKAFITANTDKNCTFNITKYNLLKDQTVSGCADISWNEWEEDITREGWESRKGTGLKTIIDYRKKEVVSSENKVKYTGRSAFKTCWRERDVCKGLKKTINAKSFSELPSEKRSCYVSFGRGIMSDYVLNNYEKFIVDEKIKLDEKIDHNLKNDENAEVYYTNIACQVVETRKIDANCTPGEWSPLKSTKCQGVRFKQTEENCNGEQYVFGTKNCQNSSGETSSDDNSWVNTELNDDNTDPNENASENSSDGTQTQKAIDLSMAWSTDKVHWNFDFNKLILLKYKDQKIYIKNKPLVGTCYSIDNRLPHREGFLKMFKFKFPVSNDHADNWLNKITDDVNDSSYIITFTGNDKSPIGKAFKQNINTEYCNNASNETRTLNVKIVNIKEEEI